MTFAILVHDQSPEEAGPLGRAVVATTEPCLRFRTGGEGRGVSGCGSILPGRISLSLLGPSRRPPIMPENPSQKYGQSQHGDGEGPKSTDHGALASGNYQPEAARGGHGGAETDRDGCEKQPPRCAQCLLATARRESAFRVSTITIAKGTGLGREKLDNLLHAALAPGERARCINRTNPDARRQSNRAANRSSVSSQSALLRSEHTLPLSPDAVQADAKVRSSLHRSCPAQFSSPRRRGDWRRRCVCGSAGLVQDGEQEIERRSADKRTSSCVDKVLARTESSRCE